MIEKIRKILILKYTVVIAAILLAAFAGSYGAYRYNGNHILRGSLRDYLSEEMWEAEELLRSGHTEPEIHKINSDIKSLHNFTYWIADKKIIRAERPADENIARQLEERLLSKNYEDGRIYHENMKSNHKKWYFLVLKHNLSDDVVKNGEVFVLANYSPVRNKTKNYGIVAFFIVLGTVLLSYIVGSFLVFRSMKYIEQAYQKQKQFVSDAAHEFRTPLTILYSYMELFEYSPKKHEILNSAKEELQHLNEMIDRLLSLARYDNSSIVKHVENVNLNGQIEAALQAMSTQCPPETFSFSCAEKNVQIEADGVMMKQLLYILLDNAVKYTGKNKKISVTLEKLPSSVKISVEDNGIGIKPEDLGKIFDRFWQAEKSRNQKGLGLGLSLAGIIVKLHKGSINVRSNPGEGSVFEVILPLKQKK